MSEQEKHTTLPDEIINDELEIISARRHTVYGSDPEYADQLVNQQQNLRGLSISGGGIRSSTFSIGVIQSLAKAGLFKDFDYHSTVSGGGYTGSMLSTLLNSDQQTPDNFPLEMPVGAEESPQLQHLRNGSNYLAPGGFIEFVRLPAMIVRGLLLNFLLVLPWIMLLVILTEVIHENVPTLNFYQFISNSNLALYGFWSALGVAVYFLLNGFGNFKDKWNVRNTYELWVARGFMLVIILLLLSPTKEAIDLAIQAPWHSLRQAIADEYASHVWSVFAGLAVAGILVIKASENLSKIVGKLILIAVGIMGPAILFGVYLLLVVAQVDSPFMTLSSRFEVSDQPAPFGVTEITLNRDQIESFYDKDIDFGINPDIQRVTVTAAYCSNDNWVLRNPAEPGANPTIEDCTYVGSEIEARNLLRLQPERPWPEPEGLISDESEEVTYEIRGAKLHLGGTRGPTAMMDDWVFATLTVVLFIMNFIFANINTSSLHNFYRDRLSKLYLIRRGERGEVIHDDAIKLSSLNKQGTYVPYHIVNTTPNLQDDTSESQRGRDSDFFFFSKLYCGGTHCGYCKTMDMEKKDRHINLGTAMAISAAAASPNMGSTTVKSLIFIMTLLNLRLGYWVPNPSRVNANKFIPKLSGWYLMREALGFLKADTLRLNVSDGGHLENLAIYEMLRRRCRTIVCIDGEADKNHTFNGLITLIRIARIDLGVEIIIDLDRLRLKDNICEKHFAIGRIIYGESEEGQLIYIKSSYNDSCDENPFLRKYRAEYPDFPHESTADQFFNERQFEAYRALGESVGKKLVKGIKTGEVRWPVALRD